MTPKPWPDRKNYETRGDPGPHDPDCCLCVRCGRFYRDSNMAALDRLRLAVEALKLYAHDGPYTYKTAHRALQAIGPLP